MSCLDGANGKPRVIVDAPGLQSCSACGDPKNELSLICGCLPIEGDTIRCDRCYYPHIVIADGIRPAEQDDILKPSKCRGDCGGGL